LQRTRAVPGFAAIITAAALVFALLPALATAKAGNDASKGRGGGKELNVMTRNLYLGADLTPAIAAPDRNAFIEANGKILRDVTANDFPVRARGLAEEILKKKPDLVGLQEVALWRTGPPSLEPLLNTGAQPTATTVRYDYLAELLARLNKGKGKGGKGKPQYRVAVSQDEFDFEAPADDARRDPGPQRGRRHFQAPADGPLRQPPGGQSLRRQRYRHPRLDGDRRQGPRQQDVPLRQHPPRSV
jgi:hypothetical protein